MSARLSDEITACVRDGRYLLSAFEIEGPRVAGHFLDFTRPHLEEGDANPGPVGFLVAVERSLRAALDDLVACDFAVAGAAGWESELRHRHRDDKRQLAFLLVALRRLALAQYVEPDMENLGLQPVNVRDAITIQRRGDLVAERFEAVNLVELLGKSRFEEPVDLSPHVAEIRRKSAALLALSNEINEAQRASDRARIERKRAKKIYARVYLRGARMFEDMCRFAGLDDLADRVRRRKGRPAAAEAEETVSEEMVSEEMVSEEIEPMAPENMSIDDKIVVDMIFPDTTDTPKKSI